MMVSFLGSSSSICFFLSSVTDDSEPPWLIVISLFFFLGVVDDGELPWLIVIYFFFFLIKFIRGGGAKGLVVFS